MFRRSSRLPTSARSYHHWSTQPSDVRHPMPSRVPPSHHKIPSMSGVIMATAIGGIGVFAISKGYLYIADHLHEILPIEKIRRWK